MNPQNLRPFQKGNPGGPGRPKKVFLDAMRALSPEAIEVIRQELKGKRRLEAAQDVLNRAWGKAGQTVEIDTPDGEPLEIHLHHADAHD